MAARGQNAVGFLSIRTRQIECLERLLNFNIPVDSKTNWQEQWKILIYDDFCRDIISTLFKVADLRKHGVTLHLNLHADRQAVQDVEALYLALPTSNNVLRIARDCQSGLYDSMHLNWASTITQDELHSLATAVAESDSAHRITKVVDQYMNFIALDHGLFSLNSSDSYISINNPEVKDQDMERTINEIVNALFSVVVTLGVVPYIRCSNGDAAAMVGEKLSKKLHDHLLSTNNLFKEQSYSTAAHSRPVLIILDRSQDLSVNLQHPWTYESMLHDVLDMQLNKVKVPEDAEGNKPKRNKVYDLSQNDTFWVDNCGQPFPKVTDEIEERLNAWKAEYDAIGGQSAVGDNPEGGGIEALTKAAQLVPELTERKRLLDMHTNICTTLLNQIKSRDLDNFYSLETAIVSGSVYNAKSALMQVFSMDALGTAEDKLRLFVIYYLCNPELKDNEIAEYEQALGALGADLSLCNYLKYLRKMKALTSSVASLGGSKSGGGLSLTDIMSKVQDTTKTATGLLKSVAASVGGKKELRVTRIVDEVMENKGGPLSEDLQFLDPNLPDMSATRVRESKKPFREAIVFMVGSGNYIEYQDLQDYAKKFLPNPMRLTVVTRMPDVNSKS